MKKAFIFSTLLLHSLFALEFGSMGNTSPAMGGAGVALKHSAWGLYYNPALLSADPKTKLGYSVGVGLKEQNLAKIADINIANITQTAEQLVATFAGNNGASAGAITDVVKTALNSVLTSSGHTPTNDVQKDLETYLKNNTSGNYGDLIQGVLSAVQSSNTLTPEQKNLLGSIAGNIDYGNLQFGTNGSAGSVAGLLENITISKGGDSNIDKAMNDINKVQDILKSNNLNISSQNGVILQLSSKTMNEQLGSLGVALFASAYSSMSIKADGSRMRLIVGGANGYYELIDNGNSFSYKVSSKNDYDQFSLLASLQGNSDAHKLIATSFVLTEIPVGYARTFYLKNGNLNIGLAGKMMNAISMQNAININMNTNFSQELSKLASLGGAISSNTYGIDVGILYELDLPNFRYLTLGLVGKNLNSPRFQSTLSPITIKPQYRLGIGYNSRYFDFAFDADLLPNDLIAFSNIKQQSQMVGGGVAFNLRAMDIRLGAMKDLRQDTGLILTGGLNVLGFLDVALQSSTSFTKAGKYSIPQYLNIRVGGSISF